MSVFHVISGECLHMGQKYAKYIRKCLKYNITTVLFQVFFNILCAVSGQ